MDDPGAICIDDYNYLLPEELIAQFPLPDRDASKLLVCRDGIFSQDVFSNIDQYLPGNSLLVFNDTRVIRARLLFTRPSGARVEVFCLEPASPSTDFRTALQQPSGPSWKCLVGNLKRWKEGDLVMDCSSVGLPCKLTATYEGLCGDGTHAVTFHWDPPERTFSEILEAAGRIPLPPYIHRPAEMTDNTRYQTIFAAPEGSVAAPTAGLHFTKGVLDRLALRGILLNHVTLHVGIGTFKPVSAERIADHVMHHEKIIVTRQLTEWLLNNPGRPLFAVGTTSARTLESLYWLGVQLLNEPGSRHPSVSQWDPYRENGLQQPATEKSLAALLRFMDDHGMDEYAGETQLMIVPGYRFRLISGLVTNFHMPKSTLLLLVAAMIGDDWKRAYDYAGSNGFRFLSYGDSCLFFKQAE